MMPARVLIAIGPRIFREGLRDAMTARLGVTVVGEVGDGRSALTLAREVNPDVVVMQARLPEMSGAEATRQLRAERPDLPVIALSANADYPLVMRVLKAGAKAYVLASGGFDELRAAFNAVREGRVYLSPSIESKVVQSLDAPASIAEDVLTHREIEVLQLLAEGKSTKRVAEILLVSTKTVETHRLHIMAKLRLYSIAELTKYAIRQGITSEVE